MRWEKLDFSDEEPTARRSHDLLKVTQQVRVRAETQTGSVYLQRTYTLHSMVCMSEILELYANHPMASCTNVSCLVSSLFFRLCMS